MPQSVRILLVDDNEALLEQMKETVRRIFGEKNGLTVELHAHVTFQGALKALEDGRRFDAVLSDGQLPDNEIGGLELYRKIQGRKRDEPFLLISGDDILCEAVKEAGGETLSKFDLRPRKVIDWLSENVLAAAPE